MLFPTGVFALFFVVVFAVHWGLVRHRPGLLGGFLLAANFVFYAFWSWAFCLALLLIGLWSWGFGLLAARRRSRGWLWLGIIGVLLWLFYFKYMNFFLAQMSGLVVALGGAPLLPLDIVLPIGISFYCFQAISYMVDAHEGAAEAEARPLRVLVYLTFFPHLAAGPIVRAAHFLPQLHAPPDAARVPVVMAGLLILGGLFKKVVIANELAVGVVDPVFRDPEAHGALDLLLACYGYSVQIFCDFSGYSDMAIGLAALLGFHFPRNFDQPFRAVTLSEFWRRWHISLSFWLRDYLYIRCFGGSRQGALGTAAALLATMLLGGLWHGAAWTFVLWGLLHGLALAIERLLGGARAPAGRLARGLRWAITFHVVVVAFVLFRSPDLETFQRIMARLAEALGAADMPDELVTWRLAALAGLGLWLHAWPPDLRQRLERRLGVLPPPLLGLLAGLALLAILLAGPEGVAPFIYFQF